MLLDSLLQWIVEKLSFMPPFKRLYCFLWHAQRIDSINSKGQVNTCLECGNTFHITYWRRQCM